MNPYQKLARTHKKFRKARQERAARQKAANPMIRAAVQKELRTARAAYEHAVKVANRTNDSDIRLTYTRQWFKSALRMKHLLMTENVI